MDNTLGTIITAFLLFVFSLVVFWWGVVLPRRHRGQKMDMNLSRQEKRRLTVSVLLILVACLIFLSVTVMSFEGRPTFWALYMGSAILLLLWIIGLAIFDSMENLRNFLLTLATTQKRLRKEKHHLEQELSNLTRQSGSKNGKGV